MKKREIAQRLERCERRLKRLECKHENIEFVYQNSIYFPHIRQCKDCGTIIEEFDKYEEFLKAKIAFTEDSLEDIREKLIDVKKENNEL